MQTIEESWREYTKHWQFGVAASGDWMYPFTWEDYMWACRTVTGEAIGPGALLAHGSMFISASKLLDGEAVLHTMLNRLHMLRDQPFHVVGQGMDYPPRSYTRILRAYCAPVQAARVSVFYESDPAIRERRTDYQTMRPFDVLPQVRALVLRFMCGWTDAERWHGLVDFAACDCSGCGRDTHGPETLRINDCFWRRTDGQDPPVVRVVLPERGATEQAVLCLGLFAASIAASLLLP